MSAADGSGEPRAPGDEQVSDASGGTMPLTPEQISHLMLLAQQIQALTQSTPRQQRVLGDGGLGGFGGAFSSGSPLIPPPGQPPDGFAGFMPQINFGGGGGGLGSTGARGSRQLRRRRRSVRGRQRRRRRRQY